MNKNMQETYIGKKIDNANIFNIDEAAKLLHGKKICIVTGVTGQDGSFIVDYLLKNTDLYIVGGVRRLSVYNHININNILMDFYWEYYKELNPDLYWNNCITKNDLINHFNKHGKSENRKYSFTDLFPDFNWIEYKRQNPTLFLNNKIFLHEQYNIFIRDVKKFAAYKLKEHLKH